MAVKQISLGKCDKLAKSPRPSAFELAPIHSQRASSTLSSRIVASVREGLFDGTLTPGNMLGTEGQLSGQFGVSRVAARDALKRLEAMGVVEIRAGAGGGARIAYGNAQLFADALAIQLRLTNVTTREIMDSQRAIEMMTAELAAEYATAEDLQSIDNLLAEADACIQDSDAFTRSSFAFHLAVADAAHNDVLKMQLMAMHFIAWPTHNPTLTVDVAEHIQKIHKELFILLQARDGEAACALMSRHMKQIRARRVAESTEQPFSNNCC